MTLELRQMRYAVTVAQHENFHHAADHLPISQSALSQQIKKLEEELDEQLFERHSSGVTLTDAGERFIKQAQGAIEKAEEARSSVIDQGNKPSGQCSIGVLPSVDSRIVATLFDDIQERFPEVKLHVKEGPPEHLLHQLTLGNLDNLIITGPVSESDYSSYKLVDEAFKIVVPANDSWSDQSSLGWADLEDWPMLVLKEGHSYRQKLHSFFEDVDTEPELVYEGNNPGTLVELVEDEQGFSILPESYAHRHNNRKVSFLDFKNSSPSRSLFLVRRESTPQKDLNEWLNSTLKEWFAD